MDMSLDDKLNMSLGDIARQSSNLQKLQQRRSGGGGGRGGKSVRARKSRRAAPYRTGRSGGGGESRSSSLPKENRVYVGNLPWSVGWKQLKDHMRQAGNVVHADVLMYRDGRSSGGGIVEFASAKDAKRAIRELNDSALVGRNIIVREDREDGTARSSSRDEGSSSASSSNNRVYVGNLPWSVDWKQLKDHMRQAGNVVHADVLMYRDGRSSGGGIVEYASAKDAKRAIRELTDTTLGGRGIFVREDREPASSSTPSAAPSSKRGGGGRTGNSRKCFVGNLPWDLTWQELKDHMRKAGRVVHADILTRNDGKASGGGIVEYETAAEAKRAMRDLHDTTLKGRGIIVREDREEESSSSAGTSAKRSSGGSQDVRVYVGNLSWDTTWKQLKDHMRQSGNVVHADILLRKDGKSTGGGIVEYSSAAEASRAIRDLTHTQLMGREIFVREDREN